MTSKADKFHWHLSKVCLDIRKRGARVYDQKVTPDILQAVARSIFHVVDEDGRVFAVRDIRESKMFREAVTADFDKPDPTNPNFRREYDKFVGNSLTALSYAEILSRISPRGGYCVVARPLLRDIARKESIAASFLAEYARKVLDDSGLKKEADDFFKKQDEPSLKRLESAYADIVLGYTKIRNKPEIGRMFAKILNILALDQKSRGRIDGHLSSRPITLHDVRYNRPNWREHGKIRMLPTPVLLGGESGERDVIRAVKEIHEGQPEIAGMSSNGDEVQAHHIFPKNRHPQFAATRENVILLAPVQHRKFAHSDDKQGRASKGFQLFCLIRKLDAVVQSEVGDPEFMRGFYSMGQFVDMLVLCGKLKTKQKKILLQKPIPTKPSRKKTRLIRSMADELRRFLIKHYVGE